MRVGKNGPLIHYNGGRLEVAVTGGYLVQASTNALERAGKDFVQFLPR